MAGDPGAFIPNSALLSKLGTWFRFLLLLCKGRSAVVKSTLDLGSEGLGIVQFLELTGMWPRSTAYFSGCHVLSLKQGVGPTEWFFDKGWWCSTLHIFLPGDSKLLSLKSCSFPMCECLCVVRDVPDESLLCESRRRETISQEALKVPSNFKMLWLQSSSHLFSKGT